MDEPIFSRLPAAMALVGLPIMVPIPPTEAARGIPTSNALENGSFPSFFNKGITAAITIEVVAELDRIIDATMVVSMIPSRKFLGTLPDNRWKI